MKFHFIFSAKRSSPTNNQSVTCESPNLDSGHTEVSSVLRLSALEWEVEGRGNWMLTKLCLLHWSNPCSQITVCHNFPEGSQSCLQRKQRVLIELLWSPWQYPVLQDRSLILCLFLGYSPALTFACTVPHTVKLQAWLVSHVLMV